MLYISFIYIYIYHPHTPTHIHIHIHRHIHIYIHRYMNCRCGPDTHAMSDMLLFYHQVAMSDRLIICSSTCHLCAHLGLCHCIHIAFIYEQHACTGIPAQPGHDSSLIGLIARTRHLLLLCYYRIQTSSIGVPPTMWQQPKRIWWPYQLYWNADASCQSLSHIHATSDRFMFYH